MLCPNLLFTFQFNCRNSALICLAYCAFLMTCSPFWQYQQAGICGMSCLIDDLTVLIVEFCIYCWIIFWLYSWGRDISHGHIISIWVIHGALVFLVFLVFSKELLTSLKLAVWALSLFPAPFGHYHFLLFSINTCTLILWKCPKRYQWSEHGKHFNHL